MNFIKKIFVGLSLVKDRLSEMTRYGLNRQLTVQAWLLGNLNSFSLKMCGFVLCKNFRYKVNRGLVIY